MLKIYKTQKGLLDTTEVAKLVYQWYLQPSGTETDLFHTFINGPWGDTVTLLKLIYEGKHKCHISIMFSTRSSTL